MTNQDAKIWNEATDYPVNEMLAVSQEAETKMVKSRSKLMRGHIGMASMLLHLELVEVDPSQCTTMATDGKRIFYNPFFVLEESELKIQGTSIHEALHVVWDHHGRRGNRHFKLWNYATDYAINGFLIYDLKFELPEGGLWDREYHGMSAEAIYKILVKNENALQNAIDTINEGKNDSEGESDPEQSEDEDSEGGEGESETGDKSGTGKYSSGETKTGEKVGSIDLDSIPMPEGEIWDAQDDDGKPLSESELTELQTEIQRAVSLSEKLEKAMSKDGTSSLSTRVDSMKEVKVDWKDQLSEFLQSTVNNDYSWNRLNRRHQWRGVNLPSKTRSPEGGELVIAVDTSGSVDQQELNTFANEVQAMAVDCGLEKVRVCYCDTVVRKNSDGDWWDIYELDQGDNIELQIRGGGGTRFDPPFNLFNDYTDDLENVQAFVYFTDGFASVSEEVEPDVPVFWCVTERSMFSEGLPFGEVIYVDVDYL